MATAPDGAETNLQILSSLKSFQAELLLFVCLHQPEGFKLPIQIFMWYMPHLQSTNNYITSL